MKLRFKQIVFSWFSGSKVYDETGKIEGKQQEKRAQQSRLS